MQRSWIALMALVFFPAVLPAAPTLVSLEGDVSVLRAGVLIPSEKVSDGFALDPFDTVTTGSTGRADVRFPASTGLAGLLHLDPNSSLYLDFSVQKREQTLGVELLTGSVSVRISLSTGSVIEVRTAAGFFIGAGPAFRVVTTPSGDVLATVSAGKLTCRLPGRTVFIEPGSVVQALTLEQSVQTLPMNVSTLASFETSWLEQRRQTFRGQAAVAFRTLATRYQLQVSQFQRAWDRVQRETDESGLRAATAHLRRAAFPLERSLFHIKALRALLGDGTLSPAVELSRGYFAKDFFRQTATEETLWTARVGEARGLYRSWAEKSGGTFPAAGESTSITWDSDYFH